MKVLWVEDSERVCELVGIAATKAARARLPVDVVLAHGLVSAEARLRLERFDLVIVDLGLPDSFDADMSLARLAAMGRHRLAVVSASANRQEAVDVALRFGCNIAPEAVAKDTLPFNRFIQRPESFHEFLAALVPPAEPVAATPRRARAA
jgi:CheY-like chemotaxis protein